MPADSEFSIRAARLEDADTVFNITKASIAGLSRDCYTPAQIANWMGERTPRFYEDLIARGRMTVCLRNGVVDAEPGEVTRLFVLPETAGTGLGRRLLDIGVAQARAGHSGPIRLEATVNAEAFYRRYGFRSTGRGHFSHGLGGRAHRDRLHGIVSSRRPEGVPRPAEGTRRQASRHNRQVRTSLTG